MAQAPKLKRAGRCSTGGVSSSVAVLEQKIFAYDSLAEKTGSLGSVRPISQEGRFSKKRHAFVFSEFPAFESARFGLAMAFRHIRRWVLAMKN